MRREGKIISKNGGSATVVLMKHSACGDCGACQMGRENMSIKIDALNSAGGSVGDKVVVDMGTPNVLLAAFIAYGIPLISLILGIVSGKFILELAGVMENIEVYSFMIGVVFLMVTFLIIRKNEVRFKESKKYLSTIVEVID